MLKNKFRRLKQFSLPGEWYWRCLWWINQQQLLTTYRVLCTIFEWVALNYSCHLHNLSQYVLRHLGLVEGSSVRGFTEKEKTSVSVDSSVWHAAPWSEHESMRIICSMLEHVGNPFAFRRMYAFVFHLSDDRIL